VIFRFTIKEQIPGGKNAILYRRDGEHVPSPRFVKWRDNASKELLLQLRPGQRTQFPIAGPIRMVVGYQGPCDLTAACDAIQHFLEWNGIVKNDKQIKVLMCDSYHPTSADHCAFVELETLE
jgi:hypothetical protein